MIRADEIRRAAELRSELGKLRSKNRKFQDEELLKDITQKTSC